jgi:hypothetical protein
MHSLVRDHMFRLSNVYTLLRQASEWGMRGLQGTFPRCKNCLPLDNRKQHRVRVLECIILVCNFCIEIVGRNQIMAVFDPEYERVINIHGYDRIRTYYLQHGDYATDDEAELMDEVMDEVIGNEEEIEDGF